MSQERRQFFLSIATLIGTIIGVGVFGIPYAFSRVGVTVALLYVVILGGVQLLQHLFYAESAIACPEPLRLAGLTEKYLGKRARRAAAVSTILGYWGAILAYVIVGGSFLHVLLSPFLGGSVFAYQVGWGLVAVGLTFFGLDVVSRISFFTTSGLIVAMLAVCAIGIPNVRLENFVMFTGHDLFLPYGVVLFSLGGLPAILEMEDILKGKHERYRLAVVIGTLVAIALTTTFGFVVWGVTGGATTNDAVTGLKLVLGPGIAMVGAVFGLCSVTSAFFSVSMNLQNTFRYDFKLRRAAAWLLAGGVPFAVFLMGAKDFVSIVSFTGAVFGGITAALVALLYVAVTDKGLVKERSLGIPVWLAYVVIVMLSAGALIEAGATAIRVIRSF